MSFSTIVISCGHCSERIGNMFVYDFKAEDLISYLTNNRVSILCSSCSCEHEFIDNNIKLRDSCGHNTIEAARDYS